MTDDTEGMDAISKVRKKGMASENPKSEIQLKQDNEALKGAWAQLQILKQKIIKEKQEASKAVNEKYSEELKSLQETYAFWLRMMR